MITLSTEEAIKELSRYANQEFYTPQNREAHRMAIEALERSPLVCAAERLPEKSGEYLVFTANGNWTVLNYSARHKAFNAYDEGSKNREIHCISWMPLPGTTGKDDSV